MPRERIQHGKQLAQIPMTETDPDYLIPYHPGDKLPDGALVREEPSLDVGWNREGEWVQLSIVAPREWWDTWVQSYAIEKGAPEDTLSVFSGVLTRGEINKMIVTLRRARDATYGADE